MPQAIIESLVFYQSCSRHNRNILFKVQLSSDTLYYYIDLTGTVHKKLSHDAYLKRQSSEETRLPSLFSIVLICLANQTAVASVRHEYIKYEIPSIKRQKCLYIYKT